MEGAESRRVRRGGTSLPPPPRKTARAALLKLFILDAQGGYAGEYPVDDECVIEYHDVLRAVPDAGLRDQQAVYLGEVMATAFHGDRMSLIAISKGALDPEDRMWVKATLTAAEAHLSEAAPAETEGEPAPEPPKGKESEATPSEEPSESPPDAGPDRAALESLAAALDEREARLGERERTVAEAERQAQAAGQTAEDEARKAVAEELQALKAELADARTRLEVESKRAEVERVVRIPTPVAPPPSNDDLRAELERDRKMLQRRALDLLDREEKLRAREMEIAADAEYFDRMRKENESLRTELEEAKRAAPASGDLEAVKRDLDARAKALQQRSMELMRREERLRQREQALDQVATG